MTLLMGFAPGPLNYRYLLGLRGKNRAIGLRSAPSPWTLAASPCSLGIFPSCSTLGEAGVALFLQLKSVNIIILKFVHWADAVSQEPVEPFRNTLI